MGQLVCPLCGSTGSRGGKPFEKQGQLNLHMYHCKMQKANNVSHETTKKKEKEDIEECTHEWRFLNLKAPIERKAYNYGYKEICVKCQDLK